MAMRSVDRAGMSILAEAACVAESPAPGNPRHAGGGQALGDQGRALLDVQLQEGTDLRCIEQWSALANRLRVEAAFEQRCFEATSVVRSGNREARRVEQSECTAAAEIRDIEPCGLFGTDSHHRDFARGFDFRPPESGYRAQSRHHAGRAVVVAALRHAVEVGAYDDARGAAVA